jgi:hypothetical protein
VPKDPVESVAARLASDIAGRGYQLTHRLS